MTSFRKTFWFMGVGVIWVALIALGAMEFQGRFSSPKPAFPSHFASATAGSVPPSCRTSQLTLRLGDQNGIAGGSIVLKQLHNVSHQACSLQGTLRVHTFVSAHPSAPLPFRLDITYGTKAGQPVVIKPKGWASFYEVVHYLRYDPTLSLPPLSSQWQLPGASRTLFMETAPDSHKTIGAYRIISVFISHIYPGKTPSHTLGIQWSNHSGHPPSAPPLRSRKKKVPGMTSYGRLS